MDFQESKFGLGFAILRLPNNYLIALDITQRLVIDT